MADSKWQKSSYSEASGNNCVEVTTRGQGFVALRDSTRPNRTVSTSRTAFSTFIQELKTRLTHPSV
ncbi:DUF397 domain-containing protein [Streptomyces hebeiensis]